MSDTPTLQINYVKNDHSVNSLPEHTECLSNDIKKKKKSSYSIILELKLETSSKKTNPNQASVSSPYMKGSRDDVEQSGSKWIEWGEYPQ